jgi:hypothetical protein
METNIQFPKGNILQNICERLARRRIMREGSNLRSLLRLCGENSEIASNSTDNINY